MIFTARRIVIMLANRDQFLSVCQMENLSLGRRHSDFLNRISRTVKNSDRHLGTMFMPYHELHDRESRQSDAMGSAQIAGTS